MSKKIADVLYGWPPSEDICGKVDDMLNVIRVVNMIKPGVSECFRVDTVKYGASRSVKHEGSLPQ